MSGARAPGTDRREVVPWVAAGLSFLLPGIGQLYVGEVGTAIVRMVQYAVGWVMVLLFAFVIIPIIAAFTAGIGALLYLLIPLYLFVVHASMAYDAFEMAEERNAEVDEVR